ncbi:hypothetical protein HMPREF9621_00882 [Cutibacterium modestum HL037PA2]|nr:hypothetical protein HMPREF9621_00882 [Cutibacterium modestum HL037PA2]
MFIVADTVAMMRLLPSAQVDVEWFVPVHCILDFDGWAFADPGLRDVVAIELSTRSGRWISPRLMACGMSPLICLELRRAG